MRRSAEEHEPLTAEDEKALRQVWDAAPRADDHHRGKLLLILADDDDSILKARFRPPPKEQLGFNWDEEQHPRTGPTRPPGHSGGEFAKKPAAKKPKVAPPVAPPPAPVHPPAPELEPWEDARHAHARAVLHGEFGPEQGEFAYHEYSKHRLLGRSHKDALKTAWAWAEPPPPPPPPPPPLPLDLATGAEMRAELMTLRTAFLASQADYTRERNELVETMRAMVRDTSKQIDFKAYDALTKRVNELNPAILEYKTEEEGVLRVLAACGQRPAGLPKIEVKWPTAKQMVLDKIMKGMGLFMKLVGPSKMDEGYTNFIVPHRKHHAQYVTGQVLMPYHARWKESIVVHELGHALERSDPRILMAAEAFYHRRTEGETAVRLPGYPPKVKAKPDKFLSNYVGRVYMRGGGVWATEVISMGLEFMAAKPCEFAEKDPEHFDLIWGIMMGKR